MKLRFPSILCAVESANRESIRSIPPDYDVTFAQNEFDAVEIAQERRFELILMTCQRADARYAKACSIIRQFDDHTPILFITGSPGLSEDEAFAAGAQGVLCQSDKNFASDLKLRIEG